MPLHSYLGPGRVEESGIEEATFLIKMKNRFSPSVPAHVDISDSALRSIGRAGNRASLTYLPMPPPKYQPANTQSRWTSEGQGAMGTWATRGTLGL